MRPFEYFVVFSLIYLIFITIVTSIRVEDSFNELMESPVCAHSAAVYGIVGEGINE